MKNNYATRDLVHDCVVSAMTIVLLIIGTSITSSWKYLSFLVVIIFTIVYNRVKIIRPIISGITVISISFLLTNVLNVIIFLIPSVILACICSIIYNTKIRFLIPLLICGNLLIEYSLHAYLFFGKNLPQYFIDILQGSNTDSKLAILLGDMRIFYAFLFIFISVMTMIETITYFIICKKLLQKKQKHIIIERGDKL